ncbi:MAG TPA: PAS domain-containing protein, partial [Rheinheimera sp.]|nr:PAS domain-containing protein [Rheinheimera sp.]
ISLVHETDTSTSIEGLILDINEVHQTNSRLMQMQQRFEMWANTMPISVWTAAYNGEPTFVNKHLCEFTGGSQEELISEYQRFIHPDDREMVTQAWLHSIRTKEPFSLNYRMMNKGGDFVMHMTKAVAHYSDEGLIERWLGFAIPTPSK